MVEKHLGNLQISAQVALPEDRREKQAPNQGPQIPGESDVIVPYHSTAFSTPSRLFWMLSSTNFPPQIYLSIPYPNTTQHAITRPECHNVRHLYHPERNTQRVRRISAGQTGDDNHNFRHLPSGWFYHLRRSVWYVPHHQELPMGQTNLSAKVFLSTCQAKDQTAPQQSVQMAVHRFQDQRRSRSPREGWHGCILLS